MNTKLKLSRASRGLLLVFLLMLLGFVIQSGWMVINHHNSSLKRAQRVHVSLFYVNSTSNDILPTETQSLTAETHSQTTNSKATTFHESKRLQPTPFPRSSMIESVPKAHHLLVVIVLSKPSNRENRDAVRDTWKSTHYHQPHYNVTVKFSLGTLGLNSTELEDLEDEDREHHDLLLLPQLIDSYTNLTRKVLYSFEWVDQNLNYSYLFKCDDDSFALLDRMAHELATRSQDKGLYWGYFIGNAYPKFEGPWAEPSWSTCEIYIPYALGGGYVLSANVVHTIAQNADALTVYKSEDVSIGVWTSSMNIERRHDIRFNVGEETRGCANNFIVTHKMSTEDMYNTSKLLLTRNHLCVKQSLVALYMYNWSRKPLHCCSPRSVRRRRLYYRS